MREAKIYVCEKCGHKSLNPNDIRACEESHKLQDIFRTTKFEITEQHLTLIKHFHVGWQNCEYGAPEINPKRPYGNSWVEGDIAKILKIEPEIEKDGEKEFSVSQNHMFYKLHLETKVALEIILQTGQFKAGVYVREHAYGTEWHTEGGNAE